MTKVVLCLYQNLITRGIISVVYLEGNKRTAPQSMDQELSRANKGLAMNCKAPLNEVNLIRNISLGFLYHCLPAQLRKNFI